jgi:hypothetical protein
MSLSLLPVATTNGTSKNGQTCPFCLFFIDFSGVRENQSVKVVEVPRETEVRVQRGNKVRGIAA